MAHEVISFYWALLLTTLWEPLEDINYLSRGKPTGFLIYARYLMISAALLVPCHIFFGSEQA